MQDKLLKVCFIISLLGILLLLFLSEVMQPPATEISSISKNMLEKSISVQGKVVSEKNFGNLKILELCKSSVCIPVALNSKENLTYSFASKEIIVTGKIAEYEKKLQIEADKIIETNK